jgi:hypothetical protein
MAPPGGRPRHLLDPNDLRGSHARSQGSAQSLTNVQRWVMSVLAVTTIVHFSAGLAIAAVVVDDARLDAKIGLNVLAALSGVMAVVVGRAIHGRSLLSPWLALGVVPGVVGAFLTFGPG